MADLLILFLLFFSGGVAGWIGVDLLPAEVLDKVTNLKNFKIAIAGLVAVLAFLIGLILQQIRTKLTNQIRTLPTDLLLSRSVGMILGLLLANLILAPVLLLPLPKEIDFAKPLFAVLSNIFFGVLGFNLGDVHGRTLLRLFNPNSAEALLVSEGILTPAKAKIIDTSVIIDGRIKGLISCGLIEGRVIVAQTVIDELQKLADSSNAEKRLKGRRGLKLLTQLRDEFGKRLVLNSTKYEGKGTDEKLLKLTSDTNGTLITTDYNLSQVAQVQEINVLNLSDLVIALRADVQPGEELNIKVVREGKEETQGVGYLEDGTMVVIEGARKLVGTRLKVIVTGALQTPTGRMIFSKIEQNQNGYASDKRKNA